MWFVSSGGSESIKLSFTISRYLKEPHSVLNIIFQRGTFDTTTGEAIKNEVKVATPFEYLHKQTSSNEKISYTLVSLTNHDDDSLNCGNYVINVLDGSTGIWWHCDDDNITQVSDIPKGIYYIESHKIK